MAEFTDDEPQDAAPPPEILLHLLGPHASIAPWAHMSQSSHGPSPLLTHISWILEPQMARVDRRFLLNRL
jgi:hypothetical protein